MSDKEKWNLVISYLKSVADLVFLTETHCGPTTVNAHQYELSLQGIQSIWTTYVGPNGENSRGIAVMALDRRIKLETHGVDPEGRWIDFTVNNNGTNLRSILLYAPCTGFESRRLFFESIAQKTQQLQIEDQYDIMAGDFNNVLSPEDSVGFNGPGTHAAAFLQEILDENQLHDAWLLKDWVGNREEAREKRPSTWFTYRSLKSTKKQWRRLDRIYVSSQHIWNIENMSVLPCPTREIDENHQVESLFITRSINMV